MAELGKRSSVAVSWIGKENDRPDDRPGMDAVASLSVGGVGRIALFLVAAVLTLWSMLQYLNAARGDLLDQ
jgi:CDP-diacylglycerol--glycerol-3-phosphate 3-phosphatidyltransferase